VVLSVLKPTSFFAEVTWLGRVGVTGVLQSQPERKLDVQFDGVAGEVHSGLTRPSCSRVLPQYPRGTTIRNTRQFSVLSNEELELIALSMGIPALSADLLGASMVLRGIPDFSHIPPGSRLQAGNGATLVVDLENRPCTLPAKGIEATHPGFGAAFKAASKGRRGIVAWVEREGCFCLGEKVRLHIPDQPVWAHLAATRANV